MRSASSVLLGMVVVPALAGAQCTTKTDRGELRPGWPASPSGAFLTP